MRGVISAIPAVVLGLGAKVARRIGGEVSDARLKSIRVTGAIAAHQRGRLGLLLRVLRPGGKARQRERRDGQQGEKSYDKFEGLHHRAFLGTAWMPRIRRS